MNYFSIRSLNKCVENGCAMVRKGAGHIHFLSMFRKISENIKKNKDAYLIKGV